MKQSIAANLLRRAPIEVEDAARIVLECAEELGEEFADRLAMIKRIRKVMRAGVAAVKAAEHSEPFAKVAWESVAARSERRPTTRRDLRSFVRRMLRVEGVAHVPLSHMSVQMCRHMLQKAFGASRSSYKKGRAILHSIFAYGLRREWCESNPVDRIEVPHVQEKHIPPLTPDEVMRLETVARQPEHADMGFSLQLMLYCGLRPNEVRRLRTEDLEGAEKELIIRPRVSKTGGGRVVPLRLSMPESRRIIPGCWEQRWRALRRAAGFTHWHADACRHSFASYHAAYFRDMPALQWEMGHRNLSLLYTRYISPVSRCSAQTFWAPVRM